MRHTVIPAPARLDAGGREFVFRSGTAVAYTDTGLAPIAGRFCSQIARRTGLRLAPRAGRPVPDEPSVRIELAAGDDLRTLPAPVGLSPAGDGPADERHSLVIDGDQVVVRAVEPVGVARGLTTLVQLLAATPSGSAGEICVPGTRILDAPRFAWRGLSLDLARRFFTVGEIRRVIDLLALYKLNVLHLHLTDDQSWPLPVRWPTGGPEPDAACYSADDLRALAGYAADCFVTIVPEVDTPGHASALMRLHPELNTGRNQVEFELPPGHKHHTVWLDPELPATFDLMEQVLADVTEIFPGSYIHIGGDEPHGMPHDLYASYMPPRPSPSRSSGSPPTCSGPAGKRRSPASKLRSGPRRSPASMTCPSCCCLACPASPTRPGALRSWPAGPTTVTASPGTAGCGPKMVSPTSAPPPWTGPSHF
jgi:hexosaminidase